MAKSKSKSELETLNTYKGILDGSVPDKDVVNKLYTQVKFEGKPPYQPQSK